ncbi:MAG: helix-turn-helix domain-containing protein, partial [Pirellulaceae bacterium]|nr:helix-turn-helix domain-containing protein [Pirellulaceae bacterium]
MAKRFPRGNRVRQLRTARSLSQEELAAAAGVSRTGLSAIEGGRLVPSVAAALALARVLDCDVESLFGEAAQTKQMEWAWTPPAFPSRYWEAEVCGRLWLYPPVASLLMGSRHDGVLDDRESRPSELPLASKTLVLATCDPAAGFLSQEYFRQTGFRLLVLPCSSRQGLAALEKGIVHAAGVHLATSESPGGNAEVIRNSQTPVSLSLAHVAQWEEGLVISADNKAKSIRSLLSQSLRWVGREEGAGARRCQDDVLGSRTPPRRVATSHWGVAEAVRSGWADVGVCQRLAAE